MRWRGAFLTVSLVARKSHCFHSAAANRSAHKAFGTTTTTASSRSISSSSSSSIKMSNNEVDKAKAAAGSADAGEPTIFDKILSGEWKSDRVYEDDDVYAFRDVNPQAPVHVLVIPKHRDGLTRLSRARVDQKALLGHLTYVAGQIGRQECPDGFRLVVNDGVEAAQSVYHLHVHVLGGRTMKWPPG